jgi:hypothetical protein
MMRLNIQGAAEGRPLSLPYGERDARVRRERLSKISRGPGMTGCGSADPGRISEVSTERGTTGSGRNLCAGH